MSFCCDWDDAKAVSNLRKHGVSFEEACTVFADGLSRTVPDSLHPGRESRFVTIGRSEQARLLVVVHRDDPDLIRIISARRATARERIQYEEES